MTKRDFFILLIKVFGLYSLIGALFSALPGLWKFFDENGRARGTIAGRKIKTDIDER